MSIYFSPAFRDLVPYVPGEQPRDRAYLKLNTNESPFPPSQKAREAAALAAERLMLYPDPECTETRERIAALYGIRKENVVCTNGSDEALNFAFMAFCGPGTPAVFADITYGFYRVFADLYRLPFREVPLREDFSIDPADYADAGGTVFIANPNAPTGLYLTPDRIRAILEANPEHVVVVDEAYIDFGGTSAVPLIREYKNLLVVQTFSKSRSMAGARLGFAAGDEALIRDLQTLRYSTNPYNVNAMTLAAGAGALEDEAYTRSNCRTIMENRAFLTEALEKLGFAVLDSMTNFVFAKHPEIGGEELYLALKARGILVRHFQKERISAYNRITVGTRADMETLVQTLGEILGQHRRRNG
ncbi:MAG: histidinol-phosphate transaminase [Lachnospiraceae bacterium]|nr:histidinol-phosphate transaminase [Lachnospiraceae bacterium]MBP5254157.1 histidinol-phosphate transaminase [Lachnospiraceae bacterium]